MGAAAVALTGRHRREADRAKPEPIPVLSWEAFRGRFGGDGAKWSLMMVMIAYSDAAELGALGSEHLAMLVALMRTVEWTSGRTNGITASVPILGQKAGIRSRPKAFQVLADLCAAGLVERINCGRKQGEKWVERNPNAYVLHVPDIEAMKAAKEGAASQPASDAPPEAIAPRAARQRGPAPTHTPEPPAPAVTAPPASRAPVALPQAAPPRFGLRLTPEELVERGIGVSDPDAPTVEELEDTIREAMQEPLKVEGMVRQLKLDPTSTAYDPKGAPQEPDHAGKSAAARMCALAETSLPLELAKAAAVEGIDAVTLKEVIEKAYWNHLGWLHGPNDELDVAHIDDQIERALRGYIAKASEYGEWEGTFISAKERLDLWGARQRGYAHICVAYPLRPIASAQPRDDSAPVPAPPIEIDVDAMPY